MTLSITIFSRLTLRVTIKIQHSPQIYLASTVVMLSVIMLSVIMLSVIMLSVIMLSVIMLSVIMLSVISLYWVSLCWVPLCWVSLCWVSLCWVLWHHPLGLCNKYFGDEVYGMIGLQRQHAWVNLPCCGLTIACSLFKRCFSTI